MKVYNYVVPSVKSTLTSKIPADSLLKIIEAHDGSEAYHSVCDLEDRSDYKGYQGFHKPAMGWVPFDFDSEGDLDVAREEALTFIQALKLEPETYKIFFSGNKGFNVYVREEFFDIPHNESLAANYKALAASYKLKYGLTTLDTSIYTAAHKLRLPRSKHPKTGLYKTELDLNSLEVLTIDSIKEQAKTSTPVSLGTYIVPKSKTAIPFKLVEKKAEVTSTTIEVKANEPQVRGFGMDSVTQADITSNYFTTFKQKVCISRMLSQVIPEGSRHEVMMTLISEYKNRGETAENTQEMVQKFCLNNGLLDRFATYTREVEKFFDGSNSYQYTCYTPGGKKAEYCSASCKLYKDLDARRPAVKDLSTVENPAPKDEKALEKVQQKKLEKREKRKKLKEQGWVDINSKGPMCTIANVQVLLAKYDIEVAYNMIKKEVSVHIPSSSYMPDTEKNDKMIYILDRAITNNIPKGSVADFVIWLAGQNAYNPVVEWIESTPWDGVSRLASLYDTVKATGEEDPKVRGFKEVLIRKWLLSAVAAAYSIHGQSSHGVLVFRGLQNVGKTSWFLKLVPRELGVAKESVTLDPTNKDSVHQCVANWLVELGELDATFKKADIAHLKSFLTSSSDVLRLPYAREASKFARRTVFFGSVNENEYLNDPTGNRRFWTVDVEYLDYNHTIDMQQLWAEVQALHKSGASCYLTSEELDQLNKANKQHETVDPIQEQIEAKFRLPLQTEEGRVFTSTEIAQIIGYSQPTRMTVRGISQALSKLFNIKKTRTSNKDGYRLVKLEE